MSFRPRAADALSLFRVLCGVFVAVRPDVLVLCLGVISDWVDGPSPAEPDRPRMGRDLTLKPTPS